jgi:hypothetical protein
MRENFQPEYTNKAENLVIPEAILSTDNNTSNESRNELTSETYSFFKDMLTARGYIEFADVNEAYRTLPAKKIIVRREDPRNILKLFSEGGSYDIGFLNNDRYSNCVEWNPKEDGPKNISNAYLEGFTNLNSIVTVIGLEKNNEDDIKQLDDATRDFYGLNRAGVRSFQGSVQEDKITFINLRVPGHLLPESELTENEIDKVDEYLDAEETGRPTQPVMIHRSYIKNVIDTEQDSEQRKEAA